MLALIPFDLMFCNNEINLLNAILFSYYMTGNITFLIRFMEVSST